MTFKEGEMCNSRKNTYERKRNVGDTVEETLVSRANNLHQLRKDRDYFKLYLSIIENKIEKLETIDKLYKKEYGI